ncbi:MAG: translation initiation factor eIF-2B [Candidatus Nanoarchaeia archaeon]|nr:translation initiation factor eIF-2B [Candidatus Nanoarchaeia archaeon]MDD5054350.1 translation initiation factor eIF-2B [Candidatus Nanoarchaeia archaeon]MDD5499698.1 translation initiation factor eIF-2B [Candidatus Nanoarchaeia archaeon]
MNFYEVVEGIKNIHIQGASAIAKKGIMAFAKYVNEGKDFRKNVEYAKIKLITARATEPMLVNGINYIIKNAKSKKDYVPLAEKLIKEKEESEEKISEAGANLIKDGMNIFTHCHSSSVIRILKKAKEQGKKFSVICFETRPLYQGRKTAANLAGLGIRTLMTIDSGMTEAFDEFPADIALVGCDALTKNYFVNKIGTDTLANVAKRNKVPFYVCTETYKFTDNLRIEHRSPNEVWDNPPKGLIIWNPAFDATSNDLVTGFITEKGILKGVKCSSW